MRRAHEWAVMFELTEHERDDRSRVVARSIEILSGKLGVIGRHAFPDIQTFYVAARDEALVRHEAGILSVALGRPVDVTYLEPVRGSWRHYTLAPGIWSLAVQRDPGGWHVCLGRHCWTTEVESR